MYVNLFVFYTYMSKPSSCKTVCTQEIKAIYLTLMCSLGQVIQRLQHKLLETFSVFHCEAVIIIINTSGLREKILLFWWRTECGPDQTSDDLRFKAWAWRDFSVLYPFSVLQYLSYFISSKVGPIIQSLCVGNPKTAAHVATDLQCWSQ